MHSNSVWTIPLLLISSVCVAGCSASGGPNSDALAVASESDTASNERDGGPDVAEGADTSGESDAGRAVDTDTTAGSDATDDTGTAGSDAASPTWNNYADGFFDEYCVECHGSTDNDQDYRKYAEVEADANTIKCGVTPEPLEDCSGFPEPKQFPVGDGPKPTDAERQKLVDWIEAGLPK